MGHAFVIEPGLYITFESESAMLDKCKQWGLLSEKATKSKAFYYKGNGTNLPCSIIGYVDHITAVIEFDNNQKHCIHPSYLKEMQASSYGQKPAAADKTTEPQTSEASVNETSVNASAAAPAAEAVVAPDEEAAETVKAPKGKAKKEKAPKLQLPEEKVKMTAVVKEFTTVPNHFSDTDDEVVIYEAVSLTESGTDVGDAWSSHSATLKKLELEIGDVLQFEAKIAAKKLTKHPVPYKINNPSKIVKAEQ